jgi:trimeric autotransporter adhesin
MKSDFLNTIFGQKSRLSAITLLAGLLLLIPIRGFGQTGCVNPATIALSSTSGSTCGTRSITISNNIFGGSAKDVRITHNGEGSVSPTSTSKSPFSFKYTPDKDDKGKTVIITVTTNDPPGPCEAVKATYTLYVSEYPSEPDVGRITQPSCTEPTGSVVLSRLPATGSWTINPVGFQGSGTTATVTGLAKGEYEFTVTNSFGCTSKSSSNVIINASSAIPTLIINDPPAVCFPLQVDLTAPSVTSGSTPGLTYSYWSDINASVRYTTPAAADGGTYFIKGTTASGCSAIKPVIATVNTLPIANAGAGSNECGLNFTFNAVATNGLGTWSKVSGPGSVTYSPNANAANALVTVTDYGSYTFRWTIVDGACSNSAIVQVNFIQQIPANAGSGGYECDNDFIFNASPTSGTGTWTKISGTGNAVFTPDRFQPDAKVVVDQFGSYDFAWTEVNNICSSTDIVRVIFRELPALNGGNDTAICRGNAIQFNAQGMGFFDWTPVTFISNPYIPNPVAIPDTTTVFTVTLTDQFGCKSTDAVKVEVREMPVANAGEDQILSGQKSTSMNARLDNDYEIGRWSVLSGKGNIYNMSDGRTEIDGLSPGKNQFLWTVSNRVCPASFDSVSIFVHAFFIPTLITPNQDGRNDYFVITGLDIDSRTELMIFDRQGIQVYRNPDYDNTWDGTDDKKRPLREDTYFYVLKPANSEPVKGFFVIRR